jgi:SET domain-containing protein
MTQALALGLGSMFNHSTRDQNVGWIRNTETDVIVYTALRNIKAGEELTISYGSARLWFQDADALWESEVHEGQQPDNDTGGQTLAELDMSGLSRMEL